MLPLASNIPLFCHKFHIRFALEKCLELKMSAQSVLMDSEASSQSSDSGPEGPGISQVSRKPKKRQNKCKAWNFQYTLSTDLLGVVGEEGVTAHEKRICLPSIS